MKRIGLHLLTGGIVLSLLLAISPTAGGAKTGCSLRFELRSKALFYKKGSGSGTITCDNGQSAEVIIKTHSGGLTFGEDQIVGGKGEFSQVDDISELFGSYAMAEAHAGAQKSAGARAMWKGDVALALSGTGEGTSLGAAFGKFKITRK